MENRPKKKNRLRKQNVGGLTNITKWKMEAINALIEDDVIGKLLAHTTTDALSKPSLSEDESEDLVNSRIYGYRYVPDVAKEAASYISMSVHNFAPQEGWRQFSDEYIMGYLTFYIFVDTQIMNMDEGYRQDLILERVYDIFQENRKFGMGELRLEMQGDLWTQNNKFGGYQLGFKVVDMK